MPMSVAASDADTALGDATPLNDGDGGALLAMALDDDDGAALTVGKVDELELESSEAPVLTETKPVPTSVAGEEGVTAPDSDNALPSDGDGGALLATALIDGDAAALADGDDTELELAQGVAPPLREAKPVPISVAGGESVTKPLSDTALLADGDGGALVAAAVAVDDANAPADTDCAGLTLALPDKASLVVMRPVPTRVVGGDGVI